MRQGEAEASIVVVAGVWVPKIWGWPKLPQFLVNWVKQRKTLITIAAAASYSLGIVDNSALKPILFWQLR